MGAELDQRGVPFAVRARRHRNLQQLTRRHESLDGAHHWRAAILSAVGKLRFPGGLPYRPCSSDLGCFCGISPDERGLAFPNLATTNLSPIWSQVVESSLSPGCGLSTVERGLWCGPFASVQSATSMVKRRHIPANLLSSAAAAKFLSLTCGPR